MPGYSAPRVLSFEAHDLPIDLPQIEAFRGRGGRDRELTIPELVRTGGDIREPEEFRRASIANFNHRMVQVAAMRSEEHTSELQSLMRISYAVFCLKKKKQNTKNHQKIRTPTTNNQNNTN